MANDLLSAVKQCDPQNCRMKFGDLLRHRRNELGLTQRALAKLLKVNNSAVAQWESCDTRPTNENMASIRRVLGITAEPSPAQPYAGQLVDDPDELALLAFWRALTLEERGLMLKMLNVTGLASRDAA